MTLGVYQIISRENAAANGMDKFFTGVACKHGHVDLRYVSNAGCLSCVNKKTLVMHAPNKALVSFRPIKLWALRSQGRDDLIRMRHYLQSCIYSYVKQNCPGEITVDVQFSMDSHAKQPPRVLDPKEVP